MAGFRFQFDPGQSYRKEVTRYAKALRDLRWMWPGVGKSIQAHHAKVFDSEGKGMDRFGSWTPLSPATAKFRFFGLRVPGSHAGSYATASQEGPDGRILHWTHRLRNSMTKDKAEGAVRAFHKGHMVFGTSLPYADTHQRGGEEPIGPGGRMKEIPARPFMDMHGSIPGISKSIHHQITKKFLRGGK